MRHAVLGTLHALKVLHFSDQGLQERLLREGRVQARLDPDHVVPVTEVVRVGGVSALVMPLIEGCSLAELLSAHRPSEGEATALIGGIVAGVAAAHAIDVVHRDLKPANVLLDLRAGAVGVRVADFGLATDADATLTRTGSFLGTPAYAAPEQQRDATAAGPRADLWSLGVIWYELLAGRRPAEDRPLDLDAIPPRWRESIRALLQPDPDARTATIGEVAAALGSDPGEALRVGGPPRGGGAAASARPTGPRRCKRWPSGPRRRSSPRPHLPRMCPRWPCPGSAAPSSGGRRRAPDSTR